MKSIKKLLTGLVCSFMVLGCLTAVKADEVKYVTMNVPFADFYAAEGISAGQMETDAVSTATTSKSTSATLAPNTYNDGTVMLGVKCVVAMDEATYATMSETKGEDPSASYYFEDYEGTPAAYKTLTLTEDGAKSFGPYTGEAKDASCISVTEYTTTGGYGDYQITLDGVLTAGTINGEETSIMGVVMSTTDGMNYAMYQLNNLWVGTRVTNAELAWSVVGGQNLKKNHNSSTELFFQYDMNGKTVSNIKLLTTNGIYNISTNLVLDPYYIGSETVTAEITDPTTLAISVPSALEDPTVTVTYKVGRASTTVVSGVSIVDGKVTLADLPETETSYTVTVSSSNYAPIQVTVTYGTPALDLAKANLTSLIEEGEALVEADATNTILAAHVQEGKDLLAKEDVTTDEINELVGELEELIAEAKNKAETEEPEEPVTPEDPETPVTPDEETTTPDEGDSTDETTTPNTGLYANASFGVVAMLAAAVAFVELKKRK